MDFYGLAYMDLVTGEFQVTSLEDGLGLRGNPVI